MDAYTRTTAHVSVIALERLAVAASQQGKHELAALLWQRVNTLQHGDVLTALAAIDEMDTELVYLLQHEASNEEKLAQLLQSRAHYVTQLSKQAVWLASELAKTWCNTDTVVTAARRSSAAAQPS